MNKLLAIISLTIITLQPAYAALKVSGLRCEGVAQPEQVDTLAPRFSWWLETDKRATTQVAYQFRAQQINAAGGGLGKAFKTKKIKTEQSQWLVPPEFKIKPLSTYQWQVRVWDNHGQASGWSEQQRFSTGLFGARWPAEWIGDGRALELWQTAPARHFRNDFELPGKPVRARLYISAMGLVEPWLNGEAVTDNLFIPGWPDYRRRLFYQSFDVTSLLRRGGNTLGVVLGDGWYSGTMIPRHQYGREARFSAFIEVLDSKGKVHTFTTGEGWRWTESGPITMNSIYDGESYDARRELQGWSEPGYTEAKDWKPVTVRSGKFTPVPMTARISPPVRAIQTIKPVKVAKRAPGVHIYDLGQNMVGWVKLKVRAKEGDEIQLRFTEMLNADGSLHTKNLRKAKATATYIAKGDGIEQWQPRFTYFGFRYVELSGVDTPLDDAIEGVVIHTDIAEIGTFESSNSMLNQLFSNAMWSQKGNFLEIPTDCPQRDERAGWTGDAQVFAPTALYNMDAGAFFRQWLYSLRDGLRDGAGGGFPDTAPYVGFNFGSAGWAEAGMTMPWNVWLHTADKRVLKESLPAIQHALELMAKESPNGVRNTKPAWGDWLSPGFPRYKAPPRYDLIATAYYAHAADVAAKIAGVLDRPELAESNRKLRDQARAAFVREYVDNEGRVLDDVQTSYLLPLAFDLVSEEQRPQLAQHLFEKIAEKNNHLATGFLGTPLLPHVLTDLGRVDLAYKILLQQTYPSWLFTVKNGATTIWERWDSWTPENGFNPHNMNSFNHYAYGSVVEWFYSDIAGLQVLPEAPGWKHFRIAPKPGGELTSASAAVNTPYGLASSRWQIESARMKLHVGIPANTSAELVLETKESASVKLEGRALSEAKVDSKTNGNRVRLMLPSGSYVLDYAPVIQ